MQRSRVLAAGAALAAVSLLGASCPHKQAHEAEDRRAAEERSRAIEAVLWSPGDLLLVEAEREWAGKALPARAAPLGELRLAGPFQHANLALYLIQGRDPIEGRAFPGTQVHHHLRKPGNKHSIPTHGLG